MMKVLRGIAILVLLFLINSVARAQEAAPAQESDAALEIRQVCFNSACYQVEVADTCISRAKGLKSRKVLPSGQGMLFVFEAVGPHGMWMQRTLIPLDIIWLDNNRKVLHIENAVPPCTKEPCTIYNPEVPARFALELNAGEAQSLSLKPGDQFTFDFQPKPAAAAPCQVRER